MDTVKTNPADGKKSLKFKSIPGNTYKEFYYSQEIKWKDSNKIGLQYYLNNHTKLANISLVVTAYDKQGKQKAKLTYFAGGVSWAHGTFKPGKNDFYSVKTKVNSDLNKWHQLVSDPKKDLDAVHGSGIWKNLSVEKVKISIEGWCLNKNKNSIHIFTYSLIKLFIK